MKFLSLIAMALTCLYSTTINAQINPANSPYFQDGPYQVVEEAFPDLSSPMLTYRPDNVNDGPYPLLIFHMGANQQGDTNIDWKSYDLFMKHLTSYGYVVGILQQVPGAPTGPYFSNTLNFIDDEIATGNNWFSTYIDTEKIAVGGHSFGGVAASQIISDEPERVDAIVYFASFPFLVPFIGQDVSRFTGKMLTIGGSEDTDTDYDEVLSGYNAYTGTDCKARFNIEGLGHAGFGDYQHPTQVVGSIGRTNATATLRHLLVSFMESTFKNTDLGNAQFLIETNYPDTVAEFENTCVDVLSTDDVSANSIAKVYPNPVSSELNLTSVRDNVDVEIYNSLGQRVFTNTTIQNNRIDVRNFQSGLYFLKLKHEGSKQIIKFVKN